MKRGLLLTLLSLLIVSQSFSQFSLKAEFRPRFEYRCGYSEFVSKDNQPVFTISNRTRLSAYYQWDILSFGLGIQDVRVWGDENWASSTAVIGDTSSIDLNEGWIGIKPYKNGFIKIGRQYWAYEDERMLSTRSWNQSEVKYDGVLFQHSTDKFRVDAGFSWNNAVDKSYNDAYPKSKMKSMNFIYLKKTINDWLNISATALASGFTKYDTSKNVKDINWQGTYGVYLNIKKGGLTGLINGYYQNGKSRFNSMKTSAYMFSVSGDYLIKKKFSAGACIDYLSGQNQKNTDDDYTEMYHSFDMLYGIRHRVFGHMDLFNNLKKSTGEGGIIDGYIRLKWFPAAKTTYIGADFHYFSLQNWVEDKTGEFDYLAKGLGSEIDLNFSWDINKIFNIKGGYSFFLATDSMEKLQNVYNNSRFPNWAWIMITAKPVFLDTAQK